MAIKVIRSVGAGDSFMGAMVGALAQGKPIEEAFRYGNAGGTAILMRTGTELCLSTDVERLLPQIKVERLSSGAGKRPVTERLGSMALVGFVHGRGIDVKAVEQPAIVQFQQHDVERRGTVLEAGGSDVFCRDHALRIYLSDPEVALYDMKRIALGALIFDHGSELGDLRRNIACSTSGLAFSL